MIATVADAYTKPTAWQGLLVTSFSELSDLQRMSAGGGRFGTTYRASHQCLGAVVYKKLRNDSFVGISDKSVLQVSLSFITCCRCCLSLDSFRKNVNVKSNPSRKAIRRR